MRNVIKEIFTGWAGLIIEDELTEINARARAVICSACPENIRGEFLAWVKDELEDVQGHLCRKCGCPLSPKVRSKTSKCPLNKWPNL